MVDEARKLLAKATEQMRTAKGGAEMAKANQAMNEAGQATVRAMENQRKVQAAYTAAKAKAAQAAARKAALRRLATRSAAWLSMADFLLSCPGDSGPATGRPPIEPNSDSTGKWFWEQDDIREVFPWLRNLGYGE